MLFIIGLGIGYLIGRLVKKRPAIYTTVVHMDAKQAAEFINSDQAVKDLKKELGI